MVVATDTMKNTAYAFAADHLDGSIEAYGRALADHFLAVPQVDTATVNIRAHQWSAIDIAGTPAPDAFVRGLPRSCQPRQDQCGELPRHAELQK
jgi:urate oxidase